MHKFSVSKDIKKFNNDKRRDMVVGKVVAHLCLTLIIILKFSVEHDRVVNNTKYNQTLNFIFSVVLQL
jgi:hypothetical protein